MLAWLGFFLLLTVAPPADGQKFLKDDPIAQDEDNLPIPRPKRRELSQVFDFVANTFVIKPPAKIPPAANVNTLGEVPDSSWFTNRIGVRPMRLDELARGPNQLTGPDPSRPWTIIAAKVEGITPGFTIRDGAGETFFVKLDPRTNPNLASAAEVISTKFFHAFGYHVPETYLISFRPESLEIGEGVFIVDEFGKKREMTRDDLTATLKRAPRDAGGAIRAVASRKLEGGALGPFEYWGTRPDDANDVIPHEDRRELRALRVFAAWLNHDDSRAINTLDTYVGEDGRGYVRHHLIDFASTLGSGSTGPQDPRAGNEYMIDRDPALRSLFSLGLRDRAWRKVRYPEFPEVGRFEADFFDPARWKPEYPNPAFDRLTLEDAFWAARLVLKWTEDAIRAAVHTGEFSNPDAEKYLADTLIERRRKVLTTYFGRINPLAEFRMAAEGLEFENLGESSGLGKVEAYEVEWFRFENDTGRLDTLGAVEKLPSPHIALPHAPAPYLMARIRTVSPGNPSWTKSVDVYVRTQPRLEIVGIEREN